MYYLYVKTHLKTGLKYLGYTKKNPYTYRGSGHYWLLHIEKHGYDVWTNIIFQTEIKTQIKEEGLYYSKLWNIVESEEWANLIEENGSGNATKGKRAWITNGTQDIFAIREDKLPNGWRYGRSKCVFNDSEKQKEFANRCSSETKSRIAKQCWEDGKYADRKNYDISGDNNPAKRPGVREKISQTHLRLNAEKRNQYIQ